MFSQRKGIIFTILLTWLVLSPYATGFIDTTPPIAADFNLAEISITSPVDLVFENGSFGETITWNSTTDDPKNFTITRDGDEFDSGNWFGDEIVVNMDHLYTENLTETLPVTFTFICLVFNDAQESISDSVDVTVIADVAAPIIAQPDDFTYEEGSFGWTIDWNITEANPEFYNITRHSNETSSNETVLEFGDWDGSNISLSVDGLNHTHWYLFTLFVNDTLGYNATSIVNVTVYEDLSPPTITSPDDISYEMGADGNLITWTIYDSNPSNYSLEVLVLYNDTSYGNTTALEPVLANITGHEWTLEDPKGDDISFIVDDIFLGNYSFILTLFDDYGFNVTDSVNVTVYRDIRAPIITDIDDFSYEEGYTGYNITWVSEENNPRIYNLTRDGVQIMNGTWHGENLTAFVDGLKIVNGEATDYTFNMTLSDFFNQTSYIIVVITVTPDAHNPLLTEVRVLQSYVNASFNSIAIQAYSWDLNNLSLVEIEWYTTDEAAKDTMNMTYEGIDFHLAQLGDYLIGAVIHYRITTTDNSSVNNVQSTEWMEYTVTSMVAEGVPPILVISILALGVLSILVLITLYIKTKTK
ncbi:MAG: hypothetical protein ACTSV2_18195 [Candidatus Thorarchaeota archaeon]